MAKVSNIESVKAIIQSLLAHDIVDAVLSPGSRNAPFLISMESIDDFKCESIVDERVAAFVALGMAQQLNKPVSICCTSGSAMLNYAPAIAEAYYQNIPLVVITADRPKEWIDRGEGQSIRQMEVIGGIVSTQYEWDNTCDIQTNRNQINQVLQHSLEQSTPVHINVPLYEPLYNTMEWEANSKETLSKRPSSKNAVSDFVEDFKQDFNRVDRVMIICAQSNGMTDYSNQLDRLRKDPRIAVLTETTANLYNLDYVGCIDRTLEVIPEENHAYIPELVITIGENIISKRLKQLLRKRKDRITAHWHIGLKSMDVFDVSNYHHLNDPRACLAGLEPTSRLVEQPFSSLWKQAFYKAEAGHQIVVESLPYSDLAVFSFIHDMVPDTWQIQMGNSSVVRYLQLFNQLPKNKYFGNRGVSGIDGCTSTAVGAANVSENPVLFVSGDHAFRYDANALSIDRIPGGLKMIVINNDGGNIFRIIDGPSKHQESDRLIEHTTHKSVKGLVEYHNVKYSKATDIETLEMELEKLFDPGNFESSVLEVFTPRELSPQVLKSYFKDLKK